MEKETETVRVGWGWVFCVGRNVITKKNANMMGTNDAIQWTKHESS